jgi:hypothetical protein
LATTGDNNLAVDNCRTNPMLAHRTTTGWKIREVMWLSDVVPQLRNVGVTGSEDVHEESSNSRVSAL